MKGLLLASALLVLLVPQKGSVLVNVNAKNGDTITGERKFRVTVTSKNPVTQVEFYVGSELRDKDTSTPYEFSIDSLSETDGDLKLRFKAYTTENETGESAVTVHIDNGVSKGAPFHVTQGQTFLSDSKWDEAVTEGRIALKADSKSVGARIVLARAYLGKGDTANAQKYAEDAIEIEPNNQQALDLLSSISLQSAFRTFTSSTGDRKDSLATIKEAIGNAVTARRKVLDGAVDRAGEPTGTNLIPWSDIVLKAGRYSLAVQPLRTAFEADPSQGAIADRLAYAYLRLGRNADAATVLTTSLKRGSPSAFGFAALAVARAEAGDVAGSDDSIKEALLADPDDPSVVAAQAYIALKFVRFRLGDQVQFNLNYDDLGGKDLTAKQESRNTLTKLVAQLQNAQAAKTETWYFRQALDDKLGEYSSADKAFQAAVLAEPTNFDAYIEEGNRSLASTQLSNLDADSKALALANAEIMFNAALLARPDSTQALTGLSLVDTIQGKLDDAIKWGEAAYKSNPGYPAGYIALGTAYNLASSALRNKADATRTKGRTSDPLERAKLEQDARAMEAQSATYAGSSRDMGTKAAAIDHRLQGQQLTAAYPAWRYYSAGGRTPVLPQPR
jgi:predicted Zn-dependent protease